MYNDWLSIGPFTVHGYGFCIAVGVLFALLFSARKAKKLGMNDDIIYGILICCVFFGFLGSKLMYCIVEWRTFIKDPLSIFQSNGFVVYGGITSAVLTIFIYTRMKKVSFVDYLELIVPYVAFAQGFGRIGCFFAGCCYGRVTESPLGIVFHNSQFAPNGVKLMPSQLFFSVADFINGFVLLYISSKTKKKGVVVGCYLVFYSIGRFFLEMFRGDARGAVGTLSTSQFYSIFSVVIGVLVFVAAILGKDKEEPALEVCEEKADEEV